MKRALRAMEGFFSVFRETLREIFDENAYARFLAREGLEPSREAYARFIGKAGGGKGEPARPPRPRCC